MPIKQVFRTALTDTWTTESDGDKAGDIRWQEGKCYKCVKFNNGSGDIASVVGLAAYYYGVAGDGVGDLLGGGVHPLHVHRTVRGRGRAHREYYHVGLTGCRR